MLPARLLAELVVVEGFAASPRQLRERLGITGVDPNVLGESGTIDTIAAALDKDQTLRKVTETLLFPSGNDVSALASTTGTTHMRILNPKARAGRDQIAEEIGAEPTAELVGSMLQVAQKFNAIREEELWEKVVNTVNRTCTSGAARSILGEIASCIASIRARDALGHQYCAMVGMHRRLEGTRFRRHAAQHLPTAEATGKVAAQLAPLIAAAGGDDDTELRKLAEEVENKAQFLTEVLGVDPANLPRIAGHAQMIAHEVAKLYEEAGAARDVIGLKYVQ